MRFEEKRGLSAFGEGLFLLGFVAYLMLVILSDKYSISLFGLPPFMLGFLIFGSCIIASAILVHFGTGAYYFPALGFFGRGELDEREYPLSARATQLSTYALFAYAFIIMLFFPSSLNVNQALFGAIILHLAISWAAFQVFLYCPVSG